MFETVAALLNGMAPVLLFLDDVHWADQGTVEMAHYVSHNTDGVLALVTCREPSGPLRDLAVAIRRDDLGNELALAPLADPSVAELATEILGEVPPRDLLRDITQRAKGNPLFVTAMAHAPLHQATLPTIVRDVVLGRLHGLSESARRLVEVVAVAGEVGSQELLRGVWDGDDFAATLRGLVLDGLVTEHVLGRSVAYRIAHPLYAEVAYSELTAHERRQVHARLAEAIDRARPDDVMALAPHYLGAGDLMDTARTASVLAGAGWRALDIHAEDEAVRYLTAARAEARDPDLVVLLLDGLGRVHHGAGRLAEASQAWNEAIVVAHPEGHRERLGPLAYWLALLESERGNLEQAIQHLHTAADAGRPANQDLATEYIVLQTHFAVRTNDVEQLRQGSAELIALGGPAAHLGRSTIAVLDNDWATATREADTLIAYGDRVAGRLSALLVNIARTQLLMITTLNGELAAALHHAEANRDARPIFEYSMFASSAHYFVGFARYLKGDVRGALGEIDKGVALERDGGRPRSTAWMLMVRAWMLIELGRIGEGEAQLVEAEEAYDDGIPHDIGLAMLFSSVKALLAIHSDHPERAPSLPDYADTLHDPIAAGIWMMLSGTAAVAAGDKEQGAHIASRLREAGKSAPLVDAFADRLAGLTGDSALLLASAERLAAMGATGFAAQARLEWAERGGDPESVRHCVEVFESTGMAPWLDRARRLARDLGLRGLARKPGTLTKREVEVVLLLGQGLSNADIAARLFLSERTVESHLRNSYAKLGITSRVALARWAAENAE